ncbi:1-acyl-sn-glycerol-3-phosphate acyltransferase [Amphritea sp. HPY]|uniref:1-acyl-sn-glycerol-3-phosphate acyltransferase n=1 Tax=Amphritea sp. HPY TaxID=3421652 RepID=UPI003D7DFF12
MKNLSLRLLLHKFLLRPVVRLLLSVQVEGRENLAGLERYIIAANHNSHLDVLLLYYIIADADISRTHVIAAEDYFSRHPLLFRIVSYLFNPLWIDRQHPGSAPLQAMENLLAKGHNIIIFPEGSRGDAGQISRFHWGIGKMAEQFRDIPVLPVFLFGTERALPKQSWLPLPLCCSVHIGPPQRFIGSADSFTHTLENFIRRMAQTETDDRQQRPPTDVCSKLIAVMGIDGSGKSSLSHNLSRNLSRHGEVCLISDRMELYHQGDEQAIRPLFSETLRNAISHYAKQARSLKSYKLPKLAELLLRDHLTGEAEHWYRPEHIIQDGSPLLNLVGWSILYQEQAFSQQACAKAIKLLSARQQLPESDPIFDSFPELRRLQQLRPDGMTLPDVLIMLDIDPELCCQRIASRGEPVQPHETADKLSRMRRGYLRVCEVVEQQLGIPVLVISTTADMEQVCNQATQFIQQHLERSPQDA